MKVMIKKAGVQEPVITEIENKLEEFQKIVGGYIEVVTISPEILLVCNEEGKLKNLKPNLIIMPFDIVVGDVFFVRKQGEDFTSLAEQDIPMLKFFIQSIIYSEFKANLLRGMGHE